jgi:hypothetical protein
MGPVHALVNGATGEAPCEGCHREAKADLDGRHKGEAWLGSGVSRT